jgi:ketosteroid isomerase-like protein
MNMQDRNHAFDQFVEQVKATLLPFISGDAVPFEELWSHRHDVTIFGAFGTPQQGWEAVRTRMEWAAARSLRPVGEVAVEELARGQDGDLGYTTWVEHSERHVEGQEEPVPVSLRVTHLFHKEEGRWRVIHRHADPIVTTTEPTAVVGR